MHPAYSVIFFTVASGAGYGLAFWLSLAYAAGQLQTGGWFPSAAMTLALLLITAGLLSSTVHLGRPERAWRAFSQWRTSWLSREGVVAVATYVPAGLLWLAWLFGIESSWTGIIAALAAVGALVTVYCTGMIYASLRTIRQWNLRLVPANYLLMAGSSGAVLLACLQSAFAAPPIWMLVLAFVGIAAAAIGKFAYYRYVDNDPGRFTVEMATGLEGPVRQLDPPHTRPNFVMREMGYQIGRRHAVRLRRIVLVLLGPVSGLLVVSAYFAGGYALSFLLPAVAAMALGLIIERWLFFAEAEHVSMLYYGYARA